MPDIYNRKHALKGEFKHATMADPSPYRIIKMKSVLKNKACSRDGCVIQID
jgi:hypothetical protein